MSVGNRCLLIAKVSWTFRLNICTYIMKDISYEKCVKPYTNWHCIAQLRKSFRPRTLKSDTVYNVQRSGCFRGYWTVERPRQQPNYHAVRRSCRERGALFEDPDFAAGPKCLYKNKRPAVQPIVWMRPHVSIIYNFIIIIYITLFLSA